VASLAAFSLASSVLQSSREMQTNPELAKQTGGGNTEVHHAATQAVEFRHENGCYADELRSESIIELVSGHSFDKEF
jgi:hypothetical protein